MYILGDLSSFNWDGLAEVLAALAGVMFLVSIIAIALAVLYIIGMYKLLQRGDKHPVGAFISPVGNFEMMEIIGMNPWWLLVLPCAAIINVIPILGGLCYLAFLIYFIIIYNMGLAKSFGKDSTGFIIGLVLLHPIFIFILGIGDNKYVGPKPAKDFLFNPEGKAPKAK